MRLIQPDTNVDPRILKALGLDLLEPDEFPKEALFDWMTLPRFPMWASEDPLLKQMITAVLRRKRTSFFYTGGSAAGRVRTISPDLVFTILDDNDVGQIYVSGYCHERSEVRVFRYDRMMAATILN